MIAFADPPQIAPHTSRLPQSPSRCDASHRAEQREVQQRASVQRLDRELCERLLIQYSGRLLAVARRMLRTEEDAADAVQDAYLSAFTSLHRFRSQSQLYTWLHRIVVNACLMKLRSQKRRPAESLDNLLPAFDESGRHVHPVTPWQASVTERVERSETQALVRKCIDRLPADFRTIVLLRDIEGLGTEATAVALKVSLPAAKTRLCRARRALRTLLERELSIYDPTANQM